MDHNHPSGFKVITTERRARETMEQTMGRRTDDVERLAKAAEKSESRVQAALDAFERALEEIA